MERTVDGVIVLDYADLLSGADLSAQIEAAFGDGPDALGALFVKNVPDYQSRRLQLLPFASKYAALPDTIKAKTTHPESSFSFGWSHGKEKFDGKLDVAKGSYYANPQYDVPTTDPELIKSLPELCSNNIWPEEDCPGFGDAFKNLGRLIVSVGELLGKQCDSYAERHLPGHKAHIYESIARSRTCKGRVLHYFPQASAAIPAAAAGAGDDSQYASWCGWHLDNSALTGLTRAMYLDPQHNEVECPDPDAGLYIRSRSGKVVRVSIPADMLAFQMGESTQIRSGGKLRATPHCVRGAMGEKAVGISRNTFAVFMQPHWDETLDAPAGATVEDVAVPQWKAGMTFGEFLKSVFTYTY
ncbi:hypothetical protein CAOG_04283 [Capsaspora owczarzaki ATCC 30864]|uniref:hypothetical protein n=1 Tax=Capsaspora owczarzaki (strain ATCC 30864) TaxID=595528 RepID=UPI0003526A48|nr:hypothetical protein CAOG_04283 [Capsaspora owczarzaki ATCC 30864]|eukprot:XP_004348108.2 hypothetical protein CAOG_04283 [Capsaspora owczarzaki ATCC 30864]